MQKAALEALASTVYAYSAEERQARGEARKNGIQFIEASDSLTKQRKAFMDSQFDKSAATADSRGVDAAAPIVQAFLDNLETWRGRIEGKNLDQQQYYQLLRQHLLPE